MDNRHVTTPFGRRSMTLGMLASQMMASEITSTTSVDKWKLYRWVCEARPQLGISDRALAVLNALLSFYPKNELCEEHGLVVFPSNQQLSLRSHGMAEQTIRRHLAALVDCGLLIRRDSPNGKRYARRNRAGEVREAFGFSLAPLLARAEEIEYLAATVVSERLYLQSMREQISLCRRDIAKMIDTARMENLGDSWETVFDIFRNIIDSVPRKPTAAQLELTLAELEAIRSDIINRLHLLIKIENSSANPCQNERHIQNSESESYLEIEDAFAKQKTQSNPSQHKLVDDGSAQQPTNASQPQEKPKPLPLGLVLQACPDILNYGPGGQIGNWRELMSATYVVRSMLRVSSSAYEEACAVMGAENTATVIACILQRGVAINSAGGYLRELTRRTVKGEFGLGPMVMALLRSNGSIPGKPN